jgi:hypothetical protein
MDTSKRNDTSLVLISDLHVEVDQVAFEVKASKDSIIISVRNIYDGYALLRKVLLPLTKNKKLVGYFEMVLNRTKKTIYFQNRHFGFFGPKANPVFRALLR